jgi:hypothetical protein
MADWQVALIAGGSAVGGAGIGSITQIRIYKAQQKAQTARAKASLRRRVYEEYLHTIFGLPELMRAGITAPFNNPSGIEGVLKPFRVELARLRVLLLLDASPTIRQGVEDTERAIKTMLESDWPELEAEDTKLEPGDRKGVYELFDKAFYKTAMPAAKTLAGLMAAELDHPA